MDHQLRSLKAQFKYADKLGARYMAVLGDEELDKGIVKLRDMNTKEEWEVALAAAPEEMKKRIRP
jgi:histidyl-tRNA synthetase